MTTVAPDFRTALGDRIEASHQLLAARWLDELKRVVPVAENEIFPGDQLLGQMPVLIREIGAFLKVPAEEAIAANAIVTARATELGRLRHTQHASVHQVLREYRALRTAVGHFVKEESARLQLKPTVDELFELMERFEAAIDALLQTTIDTFVSEYTDAISSHTTRLEAFNRMVTHELRQPLGTLQFAIKLLKANETRQDAGKQDQILGTAERNVTRMADTLGKLVSLSRSGAGTDSAVVQCVDLTALVSDIVDQVREMAEARGVHVRIVSPLPHLTIDAARLELVLVNLISNAIKYSDPDKVLRFVEIASMPSERPDVCTLRISDNGIGIAETDLRSIFARFYRGRPDRDRELGISGLGLGLSIVADCVEALKGDLRVESTPREGTTFILELPSIAESR
jgi:signal transduction histidine kinase